MPMMLVSDDEFEAELTKLSPSSNETGETQSAEIEYKPAQIEYKPAKGRGSVAQIPDSLRKIISEEALINGGSAEIAESFGVSKSSVDAYKHGATSTASYDKPEPDLTNHIKSVKSEINQSAHDRLKAALNQITDERLNGAKLRDVASVATAMANVIEKTTPAERGNNINAQIIFVSPRQVHERNFEVVDVN